MLMDACFDADVTFKDYIINFYANNGLKVKH